MTSKCEQSLMSLQLSFIFDTSEPARCVFHSISYCPKSILSLFTCSPHYGTVPFRQDFIHKRKMSEFGNLSLVERRGEDEDDIHLRMPGAKRGDMAARAFRPEIRVLAVRFSPTGQSGRCRLEIRVLAVRFSTTGYSQWYVFGLANLSGDGVMLTVSVCLSVNVSSALSG